MGDNPIIKVQLVTPVTTRGFDVNKDAKMVNCLAEQTSAEKYAGVKRSGLSQLFQGVVGCGQGLYNFLEVLYSISGDTLNINNTFTSTFVQTTAAAGWSTRKGMAGAGFNGFLWATGGLNSDGTTYNADVWQSADGSTWALSSPPPWAARAYHQSIVFAGQLWIMGGIGTGGTFLKDVWSTPDGLTWTQRNTSAWPARANFGVTIFNSKLWVAGGQASGTLDNGNTLSDVWSSIDGITWSQAVAQAPWVGRSRFGFSGFNNKLRVLGGYLGNMNGAAGDLWSSADGITWTRDSSNPFSQAATGLFKLAAMTSLGYNFGPPPNATLTGGAGTGAVAQVFIPGAEEDDSDDFDGPMNVAITTAGTGYTSAPSLSFVLGGGIPPSGYTFLAANGVAGDKRGMMVIAGSTLYYFTFMNNGSPSSEIWQSADGVTWTIYQASPAYSARDSFVFFFGSFWILSGVNAASTYLSDVWKGGFSSGSSIALSPTTTCLPFSFSQTSSTLTHPLLFFKTNTDAYTYNADLATLIKVTNANYPAITVPGIVYLDTFFFVMDAKGRIYNSAINDPTVWTALGFIPLQGEPNGGMAIGKVGQYLVAFGVWSTQFFYDNQVAAPASPLAVNSTLDSLTGCASGDSVVQMQGTIVWLGQNRSEGRGIFMIQNLAPVRISTPFIDRLLEDDNLSGVRAFVTGDIGHPLYVLTLINTSITLVYDFKMQAWYLFTSRIARPATIITSLTSSTYGLVTAISANHGNFDGDPVQVSGSTIAGYNGNFNVNVVDANTFTYMIPAGLASASGASAMGYNEQYFIGRGAASKAGEYYIQHETNGIVYLFDQLNYDDAGIPIDVRIRTTPWNGGTPHYKTIVDTDLLADNNASSCLLRYTNDDYATYSSYRSISMALSRKHLSRSGRTRVRAWELRHTAITPFRAFELMITPEPGDF